MAKLPDGLKTTDLVPDARVIIRYCDVCGHNRHFVARGLSKPTFDFKCCKCKNIVRYE